MQNRWLPISLLFRRRLKRDVISVKCCHGSTLVKIEDSSKLKSDEIRKKFIEYFTQKHDHLYVHSSPVKLESDPSLFFVNAGMNQFKPIFLGTVPPHSPMANYRRVVNSQKCIRISGKHNDLDAVGEDGYHHTFFEMLGNWSFGDYFKKEACEMAWELLTRHYHIPKEQLYVTYFSGSERLGLDGDYECQEIWRKIGVSEDRILPFGMKDNFWDMGNVGPCGPCTEIHYVHGVPDEDTKFLVNSGSPNVVEIWNLVFMQYERQPDGSVTKLPVCHIDTGMGLERITAILQGSCSNYDTDLFQPLFTCIQKQAGIRHYTGMFGTDDKDGIDYYYRVLADHARMFTICIADGLIPDSHFAGQSLRQIIRRAALLTTYTLNCPRGTLGKLVQPVVDSLGMAYPELHENVSKIIDVVNMEEKKFSVQMGRGFIEMNKMARQIQGSEIFPAEKLYTLHQAFAMPEELLFRVVKEKGFSIKCDEYESVKATAMMKRKEQQAALLAAKEEFFLDQQSVFHLKSQISQTDDSFKYVYDREDSAYVFPEVNAKILVLVKDKTLVDELNVGDSGIVIVDKTNFYAESGGQPNDRGVISFEDSCFEVQNIKVVHGIVQHYGKLISGSFKISQDVKLKIDENHRIACMQNHSACHVMRQALETVLNDVNPRSFHVEPDHCQMDITRQKPLTRKELDEVERVANNFIASKQEVIVETVPLQEKSSKWNIKTIPGMVYPDPLRAIIMTDSNFTSAEACCGTHVKNTIDIGSVMIISQKSVGQMTRTIKTISGTKVPKIMKFIKEQEDLYESVNKQFLEVYAKKERPPTLFWINMEKHLHMMLMAIADFLQDNKITVTLSKYDEVGKNVKQLRKRVNGVLKARQKEAEAKK